MSPTSTGPSKGFTKPGQNPKRNGQRLWKVMTYCMSKTTSEDYNVASNGILTSYSFSPVPSSTSDAVIDDAFVDVVDTWLKQHPDVLFSDGRIHASEDRIWQAIAGHGVDYSRIPRFQFDCLQVIAAHGPTGIVQPDLLRITGHDKRSLPHRTDLLAKADYITKTPVLAGGHSTSLLKLRRFGEGRMKGPHYVRAYPQDKAVDSTPAIHYDKWFDKMIQLIKSNDKIIAMADLLIGMGLYQKDTDMKAFRRCYNRVVEAGCLRKLSARIEDEHDQDGTGTYIRCIQLMREPTSLDRILFKKNAGPFQIGKPDVAGKMPAGRADEIEEDHADDQDDGFFEQDIAVRRHCPPQWIPDLPYVNVVYDAIAHAGPEGISSAALHEKVVGTFWRRPLDEIMNRLRSSQQSQPSHLKHLSIVADRGVADKLTQFRYRTLENFESAVEQGDTVWEAAVGDGKSPKKRGRPRKEAELDDWGFPKLNADMFLGAEGRASLLECQRPVREAGRGGRLNLKTPRNKATRTPNSTPAAGPTSANSETAIPNTASLVWKPANQQQSASTHRQIVGEPTSSSLSFVSVSYDADGNVQNNGQSQVHGHFNDVLGKRRLKRTAKAAELDELEGSAGKTARVELVDSTTALPETGRSREKERTTPTLGLQLANGLHINPSGSYPQHLRKPGRRKHVLVAVVKSDGLRNLPCFDSTARAAEAAGPAAAAASPRKEVFTERPRLIVRLPLSRLPVNRAQPETSDGKSFDDGSGSNRAEPDLASDRPNAAGASSSSNGLQGDHSQLITKLPVSLSTTATDMHAPAAITESQTQPGDPTLASSVTTSQRDTSRRASNLSVQLPATNAVNSESTKPPLVEQIQENFGSGFLSGDTVSAEEVADYVIIAEKTPRTFAANPAPGSSQRATDQAILSHSEAILQVRRANTVLDIIRKAGGVYPGDLELWFPFATHWQRLYKQIPDRLAVEHAVNILVERGKLTRLSFTFQDKDNMDVLRHIVTEAGVPVEKTKHVQREMIKSYPFRYLPHTVPIEKRLRETAREIPLVPTQSNGGVDTPTAFSTSDVQTEATPATEASTEDVAVVTPAPRTPIRAPEKQLYPGSLPSEFPPDRRVTVKRTAQGIAAANAEDELWNRPKSWSALRRVRISRGSLIADYDQELIDLDTIESDDDEIDDNTPISPAHAARMNSFQVVRYEHDPEAVPTKMHWPRPRASLGPRFDNRLGRRPDFNPPAFTLPETPASTPHRPRAFIDAEWKTMESPPKDLEDILRRADKFGLKAAPSSDSLFYQFQTEVDNVNAFEEALLEHGPPLAFNDRRRFINHGLNRRHVLVRRSNRVTYDFIDGFVAVGKAERLRGKWKLTETRGSESISMGNRTYVPSATHIRNIEVQGRRKRLSRLPGPSVPRVDDAPSIPHAKRSIASPPGEPHPYGTRSQNQRASDLILVAESYQRESTPIPNARKQLTNVRPNARSANPIRTYGKPSEDRERLCVALALCNVLCGGVNRELRNKWPIIAKSFTFQIEPDALRRRWTTQARTERGTRYVERLERTIYEPFLKAYENGELPKVDFNDIAKTDWLGLVEWAMQRILPPGQDVEKTPVKMPGSREKLAADFSLSITPSTAAKHGEPVWLTSAVLDNSAVLEKSWIRALIATKDENYRETEATRKLEAIHDKKLEHVLADMKQNKIVTHANKGRRQPGRNFIFTQYLLSQFDRWPGDSETSSFLFETAKAWQGIVENFQAQDKFELKPDVGEAEMMVLNNLLGLGQIKIAPVLPPVTDDFDAPRGMLSRWGMGGYAHRPRYVDHSLFRLTINYSKTAAFTSEHGLRTGVPYPKPTEIDPEEEDVRLPFWIDIHDNFISDTWEMVLRSVLHVLVHRPGSTSAAIEEAHDHKLWAWEVELVLDWMDQVGIAERCGVMRGGGWRAGKWWFCAFMPEVVGVDHGGD